MKKLIILVACAFIFTGCNSNLKEGTFTGTAIDTYGGKENTSTAEIIVDSEGKITSVYLDTTYTTYTGEVTTKKALGDSYGMKTGNSDYGQSDWEWYEQIKALEQAVIDNQGIDFITLDENGKTDTISGCTVQIESLVEALNNALEEAK